ncbi:MAG: hypothetical protein ACI9EW_000340, partial [Cellvibrionaceae bacterium]
LNGWDQRITHLNCAQLENNSSENEQKYSESPTQ